MVSISSIDRSDIERSTPSTSTSGALELSDEIPRIQNSALSRPGSPVRCTTTAPAILPARAFVRLRCGIFRASRETDEMAPITLALRW